eukprot:656497-Pelagomonas_calceolata.AAC.1
MGCIIGAKAGSAGGRSWVPLITWGGGSFGASSFPSVPGSCRRASKSPINLVLFWSMSGLRSCMLSEAVHSCTMLALRPATSHQHRAPADVQATAQWICAALTDSLLINRIAPSSKHEQAMKLYTRAMCWLRGTCSCAPAPGYVHT